MTERFEADHDEPAVREAFDALSAARPELPARLAAPDSPEASAMFQEIIRNRHAAARHWRRSYLSIGVAAAAAAATVGVFIAMPDRAGDSAGEVPAAPETVPSTDATSVGTLQFPSIALAPAPIGDADATRARFTALEDGFSVAARLEFTVVGDDVAVQYTAKDGEVFAVTQESRRVDGQTYEGSVDENGAWAWLRTDTLDGDELPLERRFVGEPAASDPLTLLDLLAPSAGFESAGIAIVDSRAETGDPAVETEHLVASTPELVDVEYWPAGIRAGGSLDSLEVWVDANGAVRRINTTRTVEYEITHCGDGTSSWTNGTPEGSAPPADSVAFSGTPCTGPTETLTSVLTDSLEFTDIGSPDLTVETPPADATVDADRFHAGDAPETVPAEDPTSTAPTTS